VVIKMAKKNDKKDNNKGRPKINVNKVLNILQDFENKGMIYAFSQQNKIINSRKPFIYVSFKVPIYEVDKN